LMLDPQRGGAIRELSWYGQPLLRPTPANAGDDPFDTACFPMVPYVNRVARGQFAFRGRAVQLARNWSEDPHPLHGQGWRAPWTTVTTTKTSATLRFEGGGDDWPWRYICEQRFQLLENGLLVELSIENAGCVPMPAMLGLHPYFPDAAQAYLHARAPRVWLTDSAVLPLKEIPTPPEWAFEPSRAIQAQALDHCFAAWDGLATLRWPDRTLSIRAPDCKFLHVYAPEGRDFFCVEPQSAAPGALGRDAGEATVLNPGAQFSIQVRFEAGAS
jgi:aldose 1-epimerase